MKKMCLFLGFIMILSSSCVIGGNAEYYFAVISGEDGTTATISFTQTTGETVGDFKTTVLEAEELPCILKIPYYHPDMAGYFQPYIKVEPEEGKTCEIQAQIYNSSHSRKANLITIGNDYVHSIRSEFAAEIIQYYKDNPHLDSNLNPIKDPYNIASESSENNIAVIDLRTPEYPDISQ